MLLARHPLASYSVAAVCCLQEILKGNFQNHKLRSQKGLNLLEMMRKIPWSVMEKVMQAMEGS